MKNSITTIDQVCAGNNVHNQMSEKRMGRDGVVSREMSILLKTDSNIDHQKNVLRLYGAINNLLCHIGFEGFVESDHGFVTETMSALNALDGGIYFPTWTENAMLMSDMLDVDFHQTIKKE